MPSPAQLRNRDLGVERELANIAVKAAGLTHDHGLWEFANFRALPGGVRVRELFPEAREELADCFNYLVWHAEQYYDDHLNGDPQASDEYEWSMRALADLMKLWVTLHTRAA